MTPLSTLTRVLLVLAAVAVFALRRRARFEGDRLILLFASAYLGLLAFFDVMLWWGYR
jgi:hypothetical protein